MPLNGYKKLLDESERVDIVEIWDGGSFGRSSSVSEGALVASQGPWGNGGVSSSAGVHLSGCTAGYPSIVLEAGILHLFMSETADVEEHAP